MIQDASNGLIRTVTEDSLRDVGYVYAVMRETARRLGRRTAFYGPVMVDFESLPNDAERACFKRITTSFPLPEEQVDALREVGRRQLAASAEYRRFVRAPRRGPAARRLAGGGALLPRAERASRGGGRVTGAGAAWSPLPCPGRNEAGAT